MNVGFRYSGIWKEIGHSDLLHSFFSTISFHLESNNWGSKYPYLQKKLYYDKLEHSETLNALDELKNIREKLALFKPEDIVWDAEDLSKKPSASFYSELNALNLTDCFVTVGKKNLFDVLYEVLEFCNRRKISVKIQSSNDLLK
jgi:hypothetical protein